MKKSLIISVVFLAVSIVSYSQTSKALHDSITNRLAGNWYWVDSQGSHSHGFGGPVENGYTTQITFEKTNEDDSLKFTVFKNNVIQRTGKCYFTTDPATLNTYRINNIMPDEHLDIMSPPDIDYDVQFQFMNKDSILFLNNGWADSFEYIYSRTNSSITNVSILDSSLKWNIGTHCVNESPFHSYDKWATSFLHIEGDTLMNEKHYKKLISCADSLCGVKTVKSYIREEVGRVFFANKTEEVLQFDFTLQKGDTMIMQLFKRGDIITRYFIRIDSVKTLLWPDQKVRITQYVTVFSYYNSEHEEGYSLNDVLVEGIGSLMFGLEYPMNLFITGSAGCWPSLLCFYSGEDLIYDNPKINSCYLSTGLMQLQQQPELVQVIATNHGMLELQLIEAKTGRFFVFDLNGKQLLGQAVNNSVTQFCLPSSSVYLYRFVSDKGEVQTGKVLVQ